MTEFVWPPRYLQVLEVVVRMQDGPTVEAVPIEAVADALDRPGVGVLADCVHLAHLGMLCREQIRAGFLWATPDARSILLAFFSARVRPASDQAALLGATARGLQ